MSDSITHYGVKGMKWGVHNKSQDDSSGASRESRKDYKKRVKKESKDFYQKKADTIIAEALKGQDKVLIATKLPGDMAVTLATGKEFSEHLKRGGYFDIRATEVYARQPAKGGQFEVNQTKIGNYKKSKRQ